MRKNEKGSSLIFALAVIMIITTVIAACMAISYSYYSRSIAANSERQAYLTAKSVLTNIVDNITAKDVDYLSLIPEVGESETYSVDDKFPSSEMGNVESINITHVETIIEVEADGKIVNKEVDKVTISINIIYGKINKIINADIMQYKGEIDNWQLSKYYEIKQEKEVNNIQKANDLYSKIEYIITSAKDAEIDKLNKMLNEHSAELDNKNFTGTAGYSNDNLLLYVDRVILDKKLIELNMNEFNLPKVMKDKLAGKRMYLHVMFGFQQNRNWWFIYANTTPSNDKPGWQPNLVFLPETGHWYYNVDKWGNNQFKNMAIINTDYIEGEKRLKEMYEACNEDNIAQ